MKNIDNTAIKDPILSRYIYVLSCIKLIKNNLVIKERIILYNCFEVIAFLLLDKITLKW